MVPTVPPLFYVLFSFSLYFSLPLPTQEIERKRVVVLATICMLYSGLPHFPSSPSPLFDPPGGSHFETTPQKLLLGLIANSYKVKVPSPHRPCRFPKIVNSQNPQIRPH
jgi:hypothetical protein